MTANFNNGSSPFTRLANYLESTRQSISQSNSSAGETIRNQDSQLYQIHADGGSRRFLQLFNEMQRATGAISENQFSKENNKIQNINRNGRTGGNDGIFHLSQKQIWSSFAREITKALKRNS